MKRIILPLAVLVAFGMTSCKKAYTCSCTTTFSYVGGKDDYKDDSEEYSAKMSKKTAEAACENKEQSIDNSYKNLFTDNGADPDPGITAKSECTLKD